MKDNKLVMLLYTQTESERMDRNQGRNIAGQVIAEIGFIPDSAIPNGCAKAIHRAQEWIEYSYSNDLEQPKWWKSSWDKNW